ncbi:MAG: DUF4153 domain-containing protein [Deinococcaceae bacterium]
MRLKYPSIPATLLIALVQVFCIQQLRDGDLVAFLPLPVLVFFGLFFLVWIPFGIYCFGFLEKRKDSFNTTFFISGVFMSILLAYPTIGIKCPIPRKCIPSEFIDPSDFSVLIFYIFSLVCGSALRSKNTFLEIFKNTLFILISILLSGIFIAILFFSTRLFGSSESENLINVLFQNILWVIIPLSALFVSEIRKRYSQIHRIFLILFGWFGIPVFIISGIFVGFLFASLKEQNLFEGILSSGLYLSFGFVLAILYNTFLYGFRFVPQDASVHPDPNLEIPTETAEPSQEWKPPTYTSLPVWAYVFRIVPIIMLAFPALATYGLSVRVAEYGWTPDRIWAAVGTLILAVVILGYIFVKNPADIRRSNGLGAWFFIVATTVLFVPGLTPLELSVRNQVQRLLKSDDPKEIYDISRFLEMQAGEHGIYALIKLKNDNRLTSIQRKILGGTYTPNDNLPDFERVGNSKEKLSIDQKEKVYRSILSFIKSNPYVKPKSNIDSTHDDTSSFRYDEWNIYLFKEDKSRINLKYMIFEEKSNTYVLVYQESDNIGWVIDLKDFLIQGTLFKKLDSENFKMGQMKGMSNLGIRKTNKFSIAYEVWHFDFDNETFFYVPVDSK